MTRLSFVRVRPELYRIRQRVRKHGSTLCLIVGRVERFGDRWEARVSGHVATGETRESAAREAVLLSQERT